MYNKDAPAIAEASLYLRFTCLIKYRFFNDRKVQHFIRQKSKTQIHYLKRTTELFFLIPPENGKDSSLINKVKFAFKHFSYNGNRFLLLIHGIDQSEYPKDKEDNTDIAQKG